MPSPGVRVGGRFAAGEVGSAAFASGSRRFGTVGPSGDTVLRASNGTGGGGVAFAARGTWGDDDVGDGGAGDPVAAGRAGGGVGVRTDARGRSAWSTMLKNGVSSSMSPSASHGPPARDRRSTRLALR